MIRSGRKLKPTPYRRFKRRTSMPYRYPALHAITRGLGMLGLVAVGVLVYFLLRPPVVQSPLSTPYGFTTMEHAESHEHVELAADAEALR